MHAELIIFSLDIYFEITVKQSISFEINFFEYKIHLPDFTMKKKNLLF